MKKIKRTLNEETLDFINFLTDKDTIEFMQILDDYYKAFDVEENNDWVAEEVGKENATLIRMIKTCVMFSQIAELYTGKLLIIKTKFPMYFKKMHDKFRPYSVENKQVK